MRLDPHPLPHEPVLVIDVGTSATKLAVVAAGRLARLGSFDTGGSGGDGWEERFGEVVASGAVPASLAHVAVSSVVPSIPRRLRRWWTARCGPGAPVRAVSAASAPLAIDYRPPSALGPDRLAAAVAAATLWGAPVIVVDVGTAITCDLVSAERRFLGGVIAPGPWTAYRGLVDRVPWLATDGDLLAAGDLPAAATSTRDGIRAGVIRGAAALVDGFARDHQKVAGPCPVVMTGGLGDLVARHSESVTAVDPDLTLRGIHMACAAPGDTVAGAAAAASRAPRRTR